MSDLHQGPNGARVLLASSVRHLVSACVVSDADAEVMAEVAHRVEELVRRLDPVIPDAEYARRALRSPQEESDPFGGAENPLSIPLRFDEVSPGWYRAGFTLAPVHQGPPGRAHGGVVAGILDHAVSWPTRQRGLLAYSVELTVRFRVATPYGVPLTVDTGVVSREGRKLRIEASVRTIDGAVTAEAEALLIESRTRVTEGGPA